MSMRGEKSGRDDWVTPTKADLIDRIERAEFRRELLHHQAATNTEPRNTTMTTATANTKRAAKGGEFGANGEWYEGGKFVNTIPENRKKEGSTPAKARKVQIEPYNWVMSDRQPIFSIVGGGAIYIDRSDWTKGITPYLPAFENGVMYTGTTIEEIQVLCDRFNAGERYR